MNKIVARQEIDTIIIPRLFFSQTLFCANIHIRTHHQIALPVMLTTDIGITCGTFDTGMLSIAEDRVSPQKVFIVKAVTTQCVSCPCTAVIVHVAI